MMIIWTAVILLVVFLDQLSKWLIVTYLPDGGISLIDGVLRFTYVENTGAAFGILSEHRWVFIIMSTSAIILMLGYLFKYKPKSRLLGCALSFVVGGGIGNMIDRVLLAYVVDFIDFHAFPKLWVWVFNIADSFVCIGAGMLILYLIVSTAEEAKAAKAAKAVVSSAASEALPKGGGTNENS